MRQYLFGLAIPPREVKCGATNINGECLFPVEGTRKRTTTWQLSSGHFLGVDVGIFEQADLESIRKSLHRQVDCVIDAAKEVLPDKVKDSKCLEDAGKYIKLKRKETKLTQKEFAIRCDLDLRFVKELERGKVKVCQSDEVSKALGFFGVTLIPLKK